MPACEPHLCTPLLPVFSAELCLGTWSPRRLCGKDLLGCPHARAAQKLQGRVCAWFPQPSRPAIKSLIMPPFSNPLHLVIRSCQEIASCAKYLGSGLLHHNCRDINLHGHLLNHGPRPAAGGRGGRSDVCTVLAAWTAHGRAAYVKCRWLSASSLAHSAENCALAACRTSSSCRDRPGGKSMIR